MLSGKSLALSLRFGGFGVHTFLSTQNILKYQVFPGGTYCAPRSKYNDYFSCGASNMESLNCLTFCNVVSIHTT